MASHDFTSTSETGPAVANWHDTPSLTAGFVVKVEARENKLSANDLLSVR